MITVLGASGFIGSNLVRHLGESGHPFQAVGRRDKLPGGALGHVVYCIGVTGDFRERPYDAVEAHVCRLLDLIRDDSFDSLLYVSSTRVYAGAAGPAREEQDLSFNPLKLDDLYNLSKAMGESITLSLGERGRVARIPNVYGAGQSHAFLTSIVNEAKARGAVTFATTADSSRDYIHVREVADLLTRIALGGRERIYNVASGVAVSNAELGRALGCRIDYATDARPNPSPPIDVERIKREFGFKASSFLDAVPALLERHS